MGNGFESRYRLEKAQLLEDEGGGPLLVPLRQSSVPGVLDQRHIQGPKGFLRQLKGEVPEKALNAAVQLLPVGIPYRPQKISFNYSIFPVRLQAFPRRKAQTNQLAGRPPAIRILLEGTDSLRPARMEPAIIVLALGKAHQPQASVTVAQVAGHVLLPLTQIAYAGQVPLHQELRLRVALAEGGKGPELLPQRYGAGI